MNKREFLIELEKHISILDKKEQRDIIDEYSQHIDIKMEKGMSEEEATKDFGDMKELVADILSAYHVNPEFEIKDKKSFEKVKEASKNLCANVGGVLVLDGSKAFSIFKKFWLAVWNAIAALFNFIKRPFVKGADCIKRFYKRTKEKNMDNIQVIDNKKESIFSKLLRVMQIFFTGCISFAFWCFKWCLILFVFGILLFMSFIAVSLLFVFGFMIILLFEGYPLAGITLGIVGGILCAGSCAAICFNIIKYVNKKPSNVNRDLQENTVSEEVLENEEN